MRVVIVGGGIVGVATAHRLSRAGADVVVCERSTLGAGSTDRALGGIRAQFAEPANVALSTEAMSVWTDFEETFGVDIDYRRHGYLFLTGDEATAASFERAVAMQRDHGVPSEFLDPDEARRRLPELNAERYIGATYAPTDGTADPHLALQGFAKGARREGAEIRTGVAVTDVAFGDDGRVAGVDTDDGRVDADWVVNAAGPWAATVSAMADVSVPVAPKRRQLAVVEPSVPYPADAPLTADVDAGVHFAPERAGNAVVGGHFDGPDPDHDPGSYPTDYDLDWVTTALERAADCAGYFGADTRVRNGWAGLYAVTPDHSPIIEESRPGFVNAVGFSGHGFMHSPATARVVTDLVTTGDTDVVDLDRFRRDRFEEGPAARESHVL
ncbi:MAG: NAD(P)/FAD-dependent oxidoreductase [Haloferacaceae archaeon]